jgi:hypothetical protein
MSTYECVIGKAGSSTYPPNFEAVVMGIEQPILNEGNLRNTSNVL